MKSIIITKSVLLLILFCATGSAGKNMPTSIPEKSLEAEAVAEPANARYIGEYTFNNEEEESYGTVIIYAHEGNTVSFDLNIGMGAPSYNSGEISGEMEITDGKGVFRTDEYGECILEFVFADNLVNISHGEGGSQCGFGHNVYVNNTFVKKQSDESSGKISKDMLWEIFLKIPAENMPEFLFQTIQERRQARLHMLFQEEYGLSDNRIRYDETNHDGIRMFVGMACYPTDDDNKIMTLFYYGGGIDTYVTLSNQTYEYDVTTGILKPIERPIDEFTEDEFLDESILTAKQLSVMKKLFSEEILFNYLRIDRYGFSVYFAAFDAFDDNWDEYGDYISTIHVRRNWDGKRFVKPEIISPAYLISERSVGEFMMGQEINLPYPSDTYTVERERREGIVDGEVYEIVEYHVFEDGKEVLRFQPDYDESINDFSNKINEIFIYSEKYKTKEGIGINSTIEDFMKCYQNYRIRWAYMSDVYVLESDDVGRNLQFFLDSSDFISEPDFDNSPKPSDFKENTKIIEIYIDN